MGVVVIAGKCQRNSDGPKIAFSHPPSSRLEIVNGTVKSIFGWWQVMIDYHDICTRFHFFSRPYNNACVRSIVYDYDRPATARTCLGLPKSFERF